MAACSAVRWAAALADAVAAALDAAAAAELAAAAAAAFAAARLAAPLLLDLEVDGGVVGVWPVVLVVPVEAEPVVAALFVAVVVADGLAETALGASLPPPPPPQPARRSSTAALI